MTPRLDARDPTDRGRCADGPVGAPALALTLLQAPAARAVRDTIAVIFDQRAYDRTVGQSLLDRFWEYLLLLLSRVLNAVGASPATRPIVIGVLIVLIVLFLAHTTAVVLTATRARDQRAPFAAFGRRVDPWVEAQRLAQEHRFTEAAHALYAALLEGVAQREDLKLHPSKTAGDYLRELRRRSSVLMPSFRDFARLYEVVVYGLGFCDQERYERLYALAAGMLTPHA